VTNDKRDRDATLDRLLAETMARGAAEPVGACLDADTLAAWADNALDTGELAAAEAHAADCARCQAMLAAMVKTAPTPAAAAAFPWRMPLLRWIVPLTAAAAAIIVWTTVSLRDEGPANVRQVSQSAKANPAPAAATAAPDALALSASRTPSSSGRREQETPRQDKKAESENKTRAVPDANAASDVPAHSAYARLEKAQASADAAAAPPGASPPAAAPAAPLRASASAAKALSVVVPETVIVSSNPASRWRILPGGAVQRSADGGSTWETQGTGVSEALSAGVSPSPLVCWLVGPGGVVLLSTDGRSWKRVGFPEAVRLVAVRAIDGQTATVTAADGREFVTQDGGQTWTKAP
jgi:hypothetical protein